MDGVGILKLLISYYLLLMLTCVSEVQLVLNPDLDCYTVSRQCNVQDKMKLFRTV